MNKQFMVTWNEIVDRRNLALSELCVSMDDAAQFIARLIRNPLASKIVAREATWDEIAWAAPLV